jgi:hypothetical protein
MPSWSEIKMLNRNEIIKSEKEIEPKVSSRSDSTGSQVVVESPEKKTGKKEENAAVKVH